MDILTRLKQSLSQWLSGHEDSEQPTADVDSSLRSLGITKEEYHRVLDERGKTKFDKIRSLAQDTDPSFGSFVSVITHGYANYKSANRTSYKQLGKRSVLRSIRNLLKSGVMDETELVSVVVHCYHL